MAEFCKEGHPIAGSNARPYISKGVKYYRCAQCHNKQTRDHMRKMRLVPLVDGDSDCPLCACGGRMEFTTNGHGATVQRCRSCGMGGFLPLRGVRKHDQRERLERDELSPEGREAREAKVGSERTVTRKGNGNLHNLFRREVA